jgi:hypothetical protein
LKSFKAFQMAMEPTAPCPHCKAENMAHRRNCWRCKRTLPTSFALDAELRASRIRLANRVEADPPTKQEIESALEQAIIIGGQFSGEEQFPEGSGVIGKRLLWLLGRKRIA